MDPQRLGALLAAQLDLPVRLRADRTHPPYVWRTTALRDHARRVPEAVRYACEMALQVPGVRVADDGLLTLVLAEADIVALLDARPRPADLARLRTVLDPAGLANRTVRLTRDGVQMPYDDLAVSAGDAAARWALARSSDGRQVDVPLADLRRLVPGNPVLPVQLARTRLTQAGTERGGSGHLLALAAEWPDMVAQAAASGRTRQLALHVEAVADAALRWLEAAPDPGDAAGSDPWTGALAAEAAGSVLATGLQLAGVPAPEQI